MANSRATIGFQDHSREKSRMKLNVVTLTDANVVAQLAALTALRDALITCCWPGLMYTELVYDHNQYGVGAPSEPESQREKKALVLMRDTGSNKLFKFEIPMLRIKSSGGTSYIKANTDDYDLAQTDIANLVTKIEAFVRSPWDGPAAVEKITVSGKRT